MNERIKQLAEEAGLQPFEDCGPKYVYKMEKFAELIVAECIEQCATYDSNDEWDKGVRWVANQIKKHFGVEVE